MTTNQVPVRVRLRGEEWDVIEYLVEAAEPDVGIFSETFIPYALVSVDGKKQLDGLSISDTEFYSVEEQALEYLRDREDADRWEEENDNG